MLSAPEKVKESSEFSQFHFQKLGLIHHLLVSAVIHIDLNIWSIQTDIYGISNIITRSFCIAVDTLVMT